MTVDFREISDQINEYSSNLRATIDQDNESKYIDTSALNPLILKL